MKNTSDSTIDIFSRLVITLEKPINLWDVSDFINVLEFWIVWPVLNL